MLIKRPLAFSLIILSILVLMASILITYLDHSMEGFGTLGDIHAIPLEYQISLLITYIFLSGLFFFIRNKWIATSSIIALFIFIVVCTYSFTFSSSTNSITAKIGPFTITDMPLSDELNIESKWYGHLVSDENTNNQSAYLLSGITPLVFYSENIENFVAGLGNCIEHKDNQCIKRDIAWP
jgi:hypothetical protein